MPLILLRDVGKSRQVLEPNEIELPGHVHDTSVAVRLEILGPLWRALVKFAML